MVRPPSQGPSGIADVERGGGGRAGQRGRGVRDVEHPGVECRGRGERGDPEQQGERDRGDRAVRGQRQDGQHDRGGGDAAEQRPEEMRVGDPAADERTDQRPDAEQREHRRHPALGEPGGVGEQRREVGEEREDGGAVHGRGGQRQPDLLVLVDGQLAAQLRAVLARGHGRTRHQRDHADQGDCCESSDRPERRPPARVLAEERAGRDSGDVRDAQAADHHGHRAGPRGHRHQRDGDRRAHRPETGAGQCAHHPRDEQHAVRGGQRARHLAEAEQRQQGDQRRPARQPQGGGGQHGGADHHADRERRDQQSGLRDGDPQVTGERLEDAGEHEFARAEREDGQAEDVDGYGHAGAFGRSRHDSNQQW